jgi:hypothetical protein
MAIMFSHINVHKKQEKIFVITVIITVLLTGIISLSYVAAEVPIKLAQTNWPMYQYDIQHSGQSPKQGIPSSPGVLWKTSIDYPYGVGESSQNFSIGTNGNILISKFGNLYSINPNDGSIAWQLEIGSHSRSTPAIADDGTLFWGHDDSFGTITNTGKTLWTWSGLSGNLVFGSSPVISEDGTVYVTHDGLWSFTADGNLNWVYFFNDWGVIAAHASPAIGPDGTIYTNTDFALYAFNADGTMKWKKQDFGPSQGSSPALGSDGTIYIGDYQGNLRAINPDGSDKWTFVTDEYQPFTSPVATIGSDGTIYIGTEQIYAVNPDGTLKWKYYFPARILNPDIRVPIVVDANNSVFVCSQNGSCYAFNADGNLIWEYYFPPIGDIPVIATTAPLIYDEGIMILLDSQAIIHALGDPMIFPTLTITPSSITIEKEFGETQPITTTIAIDSSIRPISWTATISPTSWISITAISYEIPGTLEVVIMPSKLDSGVYSALLSIQSTEDYVINRKQLIPIHFYYGIDFKFLPIIIR